MCRLHKESYIKSIEASVMMDVRNDLGAIKAPTHVVVGSEDKLTTVEMARELAGEIPGAELTVIDDAGHLSNIEKPEEFNVATLGFLRRHLGR
jgi:3-oxoadipate enol-lactonase